MAANIDTGSARRGNPMRKWVWGTAAFLLLLPAVAMRFDGSGVDWDARDFAIIGFMLLAACGTYELAAWMSGSTAYRAGFGIAIATAFLTVWVNLAVGMFGSEDNPLNLMFLGVLAVGLLGVTFSRLQPRALAFAAEATAVAQLVAAGVGLVMGYWETILVACFALPWLAAGQLFRAAARQQASAP